MVMPFSMKKLLEDPRGGQLFSVLVAGTLLVVSALFFSVTTVSRFVDGNEDWWIGIAPSIGSIALVLRLTRYMRSRHAR
jgi:divalent metal cation (Fe/Co/Zn/Cd) transporter